MIKLNLVVLVSIAAFWLAACSDEPKSASTPGGVVTESQLQGDRSVAINTSVAKVNTESIVEADPKNWLSTGRTYDEQRHSPLKQINDTNISELGLAWSWETNTKRGLESTPIVVDGVMFNSGTWSTVWAHDARTGEILWEFDPEVPRSWGRYACCDVVNSCLLYTSPSPRDS